MVHTPTPQHSPILPISSPSISRKKDSGFKGAGWDSQPLSFILVRPKGTYTWSQLIPRAWMR